MSFKSICSQDRIMPMALARIPYIDMEEYEQLNSGNVFRVAAETLARLPIAAVMEIQKECLNQDICHVIAAVTFKDTAYKVLLCASSMGFSSDDEDAVCAMLEGAFLAKKLQSETIRNLGQR